MWWWRVTPGEWTAPVASKRAPGSRTRDLSSTSSPTPATPGRTRRDDVSNNDVMGDPDERGHFGDFGGRFVPEALMPACLELEEAFRDAWADPLFIDDYRTTLSQFVGRPTPVTPLPRLSEKLGLSLFAKREDLAHTGS